MTWLRVSYGKGLRIVAALLGPAVAVAACSVDDKEYAFGNSQGGGAGTATTAAGEAGSDGAEALTQPASGGSSGRTGASGGSSGQTGTGGAATASAGGTEASDEGDETNAAGATGAAGAAGADEPAALSGECMPDQTRPCSEGGFLGTCAAGSQTCTADGSWGACNIEPAAADSCELDNDDNCNGTTNEGCPCVGDETRSCADAGALGACAGGTQQCADGVWQSCSVEPAVADGCQPENDDNCNGTPNEGCDCIEGATRSCADGGLLGKCEAGTQTCTADGTWGNCSITPSAADSCELENDDNCNGTPNEGCPCVGDETRSCAEAGAKGACAAGVQQCASGSWGGCSITPAAKDTCAPDNDANCNGIENEGCGCIQGQTRSCADGGLFGKCAAGMQTCTVQGTWGACSIAPSAADTCVQNNDDNCNGIANQGCSCINNVTRRSCGDCDDGSQVCTNGKSGQYGACTGATGVRTTYYRDSDGDGWGSSATTTSCSSSPPSGYVDRTGDCCDSAANVFPGQSMFFTSSTTACGVGWDYDCSGDVETSPERRGTGCAAGASHPTCEAKAYEYFDEADCAKMSASCGCAATSAGSCTSGCSATFQIKCH